MKKICMIIPKDLPVPAVKGGAIQTIVENVIKQNEVYKNLDLTVCSAYDEEAYKKSLEYKNCHFVFIKERSLKFLFKSLVVHIKNFLKANLNTYNEMVLDIISNKDFDYIFAEGGNYESFVNYLKYFKREQMVLHLHHYCTSNAKIDAIFSKLIGVSDYVKETFKKTSTIENYSILKNTIDIASFDKEPSLEEKSNLRGKYDLKDEDFVVLYCGRLIKEKGVLELIKAINMIDRNEVKLLIVGSINFGISGSDEYTKLLEEEANRKGKVVFTGYVDNKELYKYYNITNIQVIPSTCEEAAGLVCLEGMVSKIGIITTGAGGIREYTGDCAVFVDNDENLVDALKREIERILLDGYDEEKINEAYKNAKSYSYKEYYKNLIDLVNGGFKNEDDR